MKKMAELSKDEPRPQGLPLALVFALEEMKKKLDQILERLDAIEETLTERSD